MTGIDILEIERIREKMNSEPFLRSVFTESELEYFALRGKRAETLAGTFCAKEAVAKALGTGFRGFRPSDIEIYRDELGAPKVRLFNKAAELLGSRHIHVSISHCREYATAVCYLTAGEI